MGGIDTTLGAYSELFALLTAQFMMNQPGTFIEQFDLVSQPRNIVYETCYRVELGAQYLFIIIIELHIIRKLYGV